MSTILNLLPEQYQEYPKDYFVSPINIDLSLSGTFGEIRSTHFHSGIDLKTQQREGLEVYASASGYIARIKVSPYGFGKVLYIQHPNGYLTVYAHLSKFNTEIEAFVKNRQYEKKSFEIDLYLGPEQFMVKQNDLLALSGNTGGSGGPHLHFEIRDGKTQKPINPLLFGIDIKDGKDPMVGKLAVYDYGNLEKDPEILDLERKEGRYSVVNNTITIRHPIAGFGVTAFDQSDLSYNMNGVYSVRLFDNDRLVYHFEQESFSFSESRYVLAHIDYRSKQKFNSTIQRCFLLDGNSYSGYKFHRNRGWIDISDFQSHNIRIEIDDASGNRSTIDFNVQHIEIPASSSINRKEYVRFFKYDEYNKYATEDFRISLPLGSLFKDLPFSYSKTTSNTYYSDIHHVHYDEAASFKYFNISIKTNNLPETLLQKAVVVRKENGELEYEGGHFLNGWMNTRVRTFGDYFVTTDTTSPVIYPLNFKNGSLLARSQVVRFSIKDELSGIATYDAYIDGEWVLMEYDPKQDVVFHKLSDDLGKGGHKIQLKVTDEVGNKSKIDISFKI